MFVPNSADGFKDVVNGVQTKTPVYGAKTLMAEFRLARGADLPAHRHPHEQTGWLASGRVVPIFEE